VSKFLRPSRFATVSISSTDGSQATLVLMAMRPRNLQPREQHLTNAMIATGGTTKQGGPRTQTYSKRTLFYFSSNSLRRATTKGPGGARTARISTVDIVHALHTLQLCNLPLCNLRLCRRAGSSNFFAQYIAHAIVRPAASVPAGAYGGQGQKTRKKMRTTTKKLPSVMCMMLMMAAWSLHNNAIAVRISIRVISNPVLTRDHRVAWVSSAAP
jgi:hypothetical protein